VRDAPARSDARAAPRASAPAHINASGKVMTNT
jgi:hypothetical protein